MSYTCMLAGARDDRREADLRRLADLRHVARVIAIELSAASQHA